MNAVIGHQARRDPAGDGSAMRREKPKVGADGTAIRAVRFYPPAGLCPLQPVIL